MTEPTAINVADDGNDQGLTFYGTARCVCRFANILGLRSGRRAYIVGQEEITQTGKYLGGYMVVSR